MESGDRFCIGALDRNLASGAMKIFSHLIYFERNFIYIFFCFQCDLQR
jgi:hypothetical protein